MNNFPWLFKKLFKLIAVGMMLPKQSNNKPKITEMFLVTLLAMVAVIVRHAWRCCFDNKDHNSTGLAIF